MDDGENTEPETQEAPSEESQAVAEDGEETGQAKTAATADIQTPPTREDIAGFGDVIVEVAAVLGSVQMPIEQFLKLGRGAIIELDRHKDADLDIEVNGHIIAMGEITVIDDKVGITVTEVVVR